MTQKPIDQSQYDAKWWNTNPFWIFGVDERAKRRSEGCAPYLTLETFEAWDKQILDVGAGRGWLCKFLSEYGANVIGLDFSDYAIQNKVYDRITQGDMTKLPFEDKSFDLVISRENFEHLTVEQADEAFKEMLRVSRKWIYMTIWINHDKSASDEVVLEDTVKDPTHITFCTKKFWTNRFQQYIDSGKIVRREDKEAILDWRQKGRCFVYEKI